MSAFECTFQANYFFLIKKNIYKVSPIPNLIHFYFLPCERHPSILIFEPPFSNPPFPLQHQPEADKTSTLFNFLNLCSLFLHIRSASIVSHSYDRIHTQTHTQIIIIIKRILYKEIDNYYPTSSSFYIYTIIFFPFFGLFYGVCENGKKIYVSI